MFLGTGAVLLTLCLGSSGDRRVSRASAASTLVSVSIPLGTPPSSYTLARSLVSFSIEGDRWPEWSAVSRFPHCLSRMRLWLTQHYKNTLFHNALNNLAKITGRQPDVRVGANTEDHTLFDESRGVCFCSMLRDDRFMTKCICRLFKLPSPHRHAYFLTPRPAISLSTAHTTHFPSTCPLVR
jgi:hypothetical protein